jgi:uncharacterized protein
MPKGKKTKITEAKLKAYNKAATALAGTEELSGDDRIKCIVVMSDGSIRYVDCKTLEELP